MESFYQDFFIVLDVVFTFECPDLDSIIFFWRNRPDFDRGFLLILFLPRLGGDGIGAHLELLRTRDNAFWSRGGSVVVMGSVRLGFRTAVWFVRCLPGRRAVPTDKNDAECH